jgi:site-specific DNA-methyltransferase (adenine-specific)
MIDLMHGDCLQAMKQMNNNQFDIAICDPPFGIGNFVQNTGNKRGESVEWNNEIPSEEYFTELRRVSKNRIVFGANYYNCFEGKHGSIVWIKNQPMPNFSKAVIASCTFHKKIEIYTQTWTNFVAKGRSTKHPCEMPVDLFCWILNNYAKEGDTILDTHAGSASLAIACDKMGFDYVGFEKNEEYYLQAKERIKKHQSQLKLFT